MSESPDALAEPQPRVCLETVVPDGNRGAATAEDRRLQGGRSVGRVLQVPHLRDQKGRLCAEGPRCHSWLDRSQAARVALEA